MQPLVKNMSSNGCDSMASLLTSLSQSLTQVPLATVPAVLDCILVSTGSSSSALFTSLLDTFHDLTKVFHVLKSLFSGFLYAYI